MDQRPRLGWIVWLAALTAAVTALWTVLSYRPSKEQLEAIRDRAGNEDRRRAQVMTGERNMRRLIREERWADALSDAEKWVETDPASVEAHFWASYLNSVTPGGASRSRSIARRGLELSEEWVERNPMTPLAHVYHGWMLRLAAGDNPRESQARLAAKAAFARAAELLRDAEGVDSPERWAYTMASYLSLAERPDEAITYLSRAIESGWTNSRSRQWMMVDPNLEALRGHEDFAALMVRMDEIVHVQEGAGVDPPAVSDTPASERDERRRRALEGQAPDAASPSREPR